MKKGFTLIELLAVIFVLGLIALITTTIVLNIVNKSKKDAFEDSVYTAINSYVNKEAGTLFNYEGEMDIKDLIQKETSLKSGKVTRNENNEVIAVNITDGFFCANGPKNNLVVTEGNCE